MDKLALSSSSRAEERERKNISTSGKSTPPAMELGPTEEAEKEAGKYSCLVQEISCAFDKVLQRHPEI